MTTIAPVRAPASTRPAGVLVALAVPPELAALLTGRRGGPLSWLLGAGSRSELLTAALTAGLDEATPDD